MNALENHVTSTMSSVLYTSIYKPYIRENPMRDSSQLNKLRQELFILYLAFHELNTTSNPLLFLILSIPPSYAAY